MDGRIHVRHPRAHSHADRFRHSKELLSFAKEQSERLSSGPVDAAAATGTLTLGSNPSDTQTVTIGSKTYTFQAELTEADGNVLIGEDATATATNLFHAINKSGGTAGTDYASATTAHPDVSATNPSAGHVLATAKSAGSAGNAIATTSTATGGTWSAAHLSGGVDAEDAVEFDAVDALTRNTSQAIENAQSVDDLA